MRCLRSVRLISSFENDNACAYPTRRGYAVYCSQAAEIPEQPPCARALRVGMSRGGEMKVDFRGPYAPLVRFSRIGRENNGINTRNNGSSPENNRGG